MNNNLESGGGVESRHAQSDASLHVGAESGGEMHTWTLHSKSASATAGVATGPPGSFQNLELSGGVDGHARIRRDGTGRINPAVGLLDGAKVTHGRSCVIPLIAPTQAGIKSGPLDSFISFNQRYVLRLMVWTFLLGFAWATITWLARVTHGTEQLNAHVWDYYHANIGIWTAGMVHSTSNHIGLIESSNSVLHSNFEPVVVKTNGRWRITFKP